MSIQVPRATDQTGRQSAQERALEREWTRARALYRQDTQRWGFGTEKAKAAWLRRIEKTRSH